MADCERLEMCPFFMDKMQATPNIASLLKQTYCRTDKTQCARYQVIKVGMTPPTDLLPNDSERAQKILRTRV